MNYKHDIFISHNRADKAWAEHLASAIEADKSGPPLNVFFDKWDVLPGADVPIELENALQTSRYVGLVLSPESLSSDWVAMERSTAIYRDPRARSQHLIPLLRRTCTVPDMLARLNYIDFRRDREFDSGFSTLMNVLRGRPLPRGGQRDISDVHFREDAELLRRHRQVFDRPAFSVSCIWELFLRELIEAIDDTNAALNTGSLYSRSRNLVATFPSRSEYRLPEFKAAFGRIVSILTDLKRTVVEFEHSFRRANPDCHHHENFYAMLMSFCSHPEPQTIRRTVDLMDRIDQMRNEILDELNRLLVKSGLDTFKTIELSSAILKQRNIGGADVIAAFLE